MSRRPIIDQQHQAIEFDVSFGERGIIDIDKNLRLQAIGIGNNQVSLQVSFKPPGQTLIELESQVISGLGGEPYYADLKKKKAFWSDGTKIRQIIPGGPFYNKLLRLKEALIAGKKTGPFDFDVGDTRIEKIGPFEFEIKGISFQGEIEVYLTKISNDPIEPKERIVFGQPLNAKKDEPGFYFFNDLTRKNEKVTLESRFIERMAIQHEQTEEVMKEIKKGKKFVKDKMSTPITRRDFKRVDYKDYRTPLPKVEMIFGNYGSIILMAIAGLLGLSIIHKWVSDQPDADMEEYMKLKRSERRMKQKEAKAKVKKIDALTREKVAKETQITADEEIKDIKKVREALKKREKKILRQETALGRREIGKPMTSRELLKDIEDKRTMQRVMAGEDAEPLKIDQVTVGDQGVKLIEKGIEATGRVGEQFIKSTGDVLGTTVRSVIPPVAKITGEIVKAPLDITKEIIKVPAKVLKLTKEERLQRRRLEAQRQLQAERLEAQRELQAERLGLTPEIQVQPERVRPQPERLRLTPEIQVQPKKVTPQPERVKPEIMRPTFVELPRPEPTPEEIEDIRDVTVEEKIDIESGKFRDIDAIEELEKVVDNDEKFKEEFNDVFVPKTFILEGHPKVPIWRTKQLGLLSSGELNLKLEKQKNMLKVPQILERELNNENFDILTQVVEESSENLSDKLIDIVKELKKTKSPEWGIKADLLLDKFDKRKDAEEDRSKRFENFRNQILKAKASERKNILQEHFGSEIGAISIVKKKVKDPKRVEKLEAMLSDVLKQPFGKIDEKKIKEEIEEEFPEKFSEASKKSIAKGVKKKHGKIAKKFTEEMEPFIEKKKFQKPRIKKALKKKKIF
jgi:hypothetical protein